MNDWCKGKTVLVTGAGRGIGRAVAERFCRAGARVLVNYSNSREAAEELSGNLKDDGFDAQPMHADVADGRAVEKMIDDIARQYGALDVLVNNAGIRKDGLVAMMPDEDWDRVMAVNLKGVFNTCKWASRLMIRARRGKIINMTSVSAFKGAPGQANYAATKGGIVSLTRTLAAELAAYGIQVNAVAPGLIETDMTAELERMKSDMVARIPAGRLGTPADVAGGVLFLASPDADYVTGQTLVIDGGLT